MDELIATTRSSQLQPMMKNIYSLVLFPIIYAELAERGLDLFVDAWSESGEVTDFSDATHELIPFRRLYKEVMDQMEAEKGQV